MKTMIAVPCMDSVQTEFCQSLCNMKRVGTIQHAFHSCSLIYSARNDLGRLAVTEETDYVLWLDSDVVFPDSLMEDLLKDMEGKDIVTGIYHMRRPPYLPTVWTKLRTGILPEDKVNEVLSEYPDDEMFEIEGCGFGCIMMRTKVLKDVIDKYDALFDPLPGYGEDLSFCLRARGCGYTIWCDPRLQIGHKAGLIVTRETCEAYRKKVGGLE